MSFKPPGAHSTVSNSPTVPIRPESPAATSARVFALLLITASLLAVWLRLSLNFSSGHMDEYDYLFIGRMLLDGQQWPTLQYVFGADFNWYLYGWAERLAGVPEATDNPAAGLVSARSLAAILGLVSIAAIYWFAFELWGSGKIALLSAVLLALTANHIFISRLTTYDIVSFTLLALALPPLLKVCLAPKSSRYSLLWCLWLVAGALLLVAAALSKYTLLAYLPLVALLMLALAPGAALVGVLAGSVVIGGYIGLNWPDLLVLYQNQLVGTHGANTTRTDIVARTLSDSGLLLGLWLAAVLVVVFKPGLTQVDIGQKNQQREVMLRLMLLLLFASPLFAYHLVGSNLISLHKHLSLTALFLVPAAAWVIVTVVNAIQQAAADRGILAKAISVGLLPVLLLTYAALNFGQLRDAESGFPDMSGLLHKQHLLTANGNVTVNGSTQLQSEPLQDGHWNGSDITVLSEDPYLFRYLLYGKVPQQNLSETGWLDNDDDGHHSLDDVKDALWDRKFSVVLLNDQVHPERNAEFRKILAIRGYQLILDQPYQLTNLLSSNTTGRLSLYQLGGDRSMKFSGTE